MCTTNGVVALDVVVCLVQDRQSFPSCMGEHRRQIRHFHETEMDGYMPKSVFKLFKANPILGLNSGNAFEVYRQGNGRLMKGSSLLHVVEDDRWYRIAKSRQEYCGARDADDVVLAQAGKKLAWLMRTLGISPMQSLNAEMPRRHNNEHKDTEHQRDPAAF